MSRVKITLPTIEWQPPHSLRVYGKYLSMVCEDRYQAIALAGIMYHAECNMQDLRDEGRKWVPSMWVWIRFSLNEFNAFARSDVRLPRYQRTMRRLEDAGLVQSTLSLLEVPGPLRCETRNYLLHTKWPDFVVFREERKGRR